MTDRGDATSLNVLLDHLKRARGFDFTGYKRTSLERRLDKRMEAVGAATYTDYLDHLELHPDEFGELFTTILINVTAFFRDPAAWDYIATEILPALLARKGDDGPIRVWSAGCASGEEAYTIAMLLAELMGERDFCERVKIYATDADEQALDEARLAVYSAKQMEAVPEHLRDRFFDRVDQRYTFRRDLRRTVIFGRNDLVQDAPISRVDLLLCRNTLMYFNAETQGQILRRLHFALDPDGHLFLGKSEMLITHSDLFAPASLQRRVFTKIQKRSLRDRLLTAASGPLDGLRPLGDPASVHEAVFDTTPVAQLVVSVDGTLMMANQQARTLLRLAPADAGRPLKDLEVSYRPVELRANLEDVFEHDRVMTVAGSVPAGADERARRLEVVITPLHGDGEIIGACITYNDLTREQRAVEEARQAKEELSAAYEELQSTIEELETTNEELQSTNEELETMNEELQSTNEELETMNEELRTRTTELNDVNALMETILESMGVAVAVLDLQQRVQVWNARAEQMWGLRREESEGEHLLNLDIGLPVDELHRPLKLVLAGEATDERLPLDAVDRRGRPFVCTVTILPLSLAPSGAVTGATLLMERAEAG